MPDVYSVPLDGYLMQLRPSELESVAAGLDELDAWSARSLLSLVEAVRTMPLTDRAPLWELMVRRFGRHKPLAQAAAELGMDAIHARDLLTTFEQVLANLPRPEDAGAG